MSRSPSTKGRRFSALAATISSNDTPLEARNSNRSRCASAFAASGSYRPRSSYGARSTEGGYCWPSSRRVVRRGAGAAPLVGRDPDDAGLERDKEVSIRALHRRTHAIEEG